MFCPPSSQILATPLTGKRKDISDETEASKKSTNHVNLGGTAGSSININAAEKGKNASTSRSKQKKLDSSTTRAQINKKLRINGPARSFNFLRDYTPNRYTTNNGYVN